MRIPEVCGAQARLGHTVAVLPLRLAAYARLAFREGLQAPYLRNPWAGLKS